MTFTFIYTQEKIIIRAAVCIILYPRQHRGIYLDLEGRHILHGKEEYILEIDETQKEATRKRLLSFSE